MPPGPSCDAGAENQSLPAGTGKVETPLMLPQNKGRVVPARHEGREATSDSIRLPPVEASRARRGRFGRRNASETRLGGTALERQALLTSPVRTLTFTSWTTTPTAMPAMFWSITGAPPATASSSVSVSSMGRINFSVFVWVIVRSFFLFAFLVGFGMFAAFCVRWDDGAVTGSPSSTGPTQRPFAAFHSNDE